MVKEKQRVQHRGRTMPLSTFGSDGQRKYLTRAEADRFLSSARKEALIVYTFCWFIAATGCRISEALMMTVQGIDFEAGIVIMESLKKRRSGVFRAVPLPANLLEALEKLIRASNLPPDRRLWPWSRMTGYRRIIEVMEKAHIAGPWATPKGLRHGFGVRAVQSGVPLHMVQRWLGHADMKTTAIYASAVGPEERDIASRTWLKQDSRGQERPQPLRSTLDRESDVMPPPLSEPVETILSMEQGPMEPRKPWHKRLFSKNEIFATCQMIQFYLFRNKIYDDIS